MFSELYSSLIFLVTIVVVSFSLITYLGGKTKSSKIFSLATLFFGIWAFFTGLLIMTRNTVLAELSVRLCYFLGTIIASIFYIFFKVFPSEGGISKKILFQVFTYELIFFYLILFTDLFVANVSFDVISDLWKWETRPLSFIFDIYFFVIFYKGISSLYSIYKCHPNDKLRNNLKYIILTLLTGTLPPFIFDVLLNHFQIFYLNWLGPVTGLFWVTIIGYSMLKYQQMDVRLVFSEVFVVAMAVIFSVNIFVDLPYPFLGKFLLPLVFCLLGYLLIRSILNESEQREKIINLNHTLADLNQNLAQKVEAQTKEIRKAYEVEKRAKEEIEKLDQNKSDFIIITQHHLRTPLSQIRWYLDSIANGLYGQVSDEVSNAIENTTKITGKLYKILNHFLDISRLKVGHKMLNLEATNLKHVIESSVYELRNDLKKRSVSVEFTGNDWPELNCDAEKIKDVVLIILDNAIKYNQDGGTITVKGIDNRKSFIVSISNTGLVFNRVDLESIFRDTFYRSAEAKRMNPTGMGVSLLVARTIMHAHKGSISLDIDDKGLSCVSLQFKKI